jgi:hypothetical protein
MEKSHNAPLRSRPGDAAEFTTGRPTVAHNSGTAELPAALRRSFESASLSESEFLRLPQPGTRCRLTGLSRSTLNELIEAGAIRAVTIRQPGARRGIKLLNRRSVLDYLARLDEEQNGPSTQRESEVAQ